MLFVAGPHIDLLNFIQVLSWIILPVLASAVLVSIYWHHRKKKPGRKEATEDDMLLSFTGQIGYTNGKGEYVSFDHSELMQEFKKQLSYSHARYTALQHDFVAIDTKYAALANYARTHYFTFKKRPMENIHEQLPEHLQADINKLAESEAIEKKSLQTKLLQLERSFQRLEDENKVLKEQIQLETASDPERMAIINKWREENTHLKDKIDNQEYLQDLVDEKKAQVVFLQNQLEQRIKNLYQSEHQRLKTVAEMKQLKEEKESIKNQMASLNNELLLKQEQIDKTQIILCEREEQMTEKLRLLNEKADHISQLESMLRETKDQDSNLNLSLTESREQVNDLQRQLADERLRAQVLEQKVAANKQSVRRLYEELSTFIDEGNEDLSVAQSLSKFHGQESGEIIMK